MIGGHRRLDSLLTQNAGLTGGVILHPLAVVLRVLHGVLIQRDVFQDFRLRSQFRGLFQFRPQLCNQPIQPRGMAFRSEFPAGFR